MQKILNSLGDFPRKERRTYSKDTGKDFVNVLSDPIKEGLNLCHDLLYLLIHCVCNEVISRKVKTETSTSNAANPASTSGAIVRRRNDIQLVNAEQCVFQFFRFLGSVTQTVSGFVCAACHTADCVSSRVKIGNGDTEESCDNFSDQTNSFRQGDCVRQNCFQDGKKQITQSTSRLIYLCLQNTKLVCGCFQCTSHVSLCRGYLCHNGVITQLCFFSLSHGRHAFFNAEIVGFLLQPCHRQVVTESTKRLKFARDTGLQLLKSVRGTDIEERSQVVGELGEVFAHGISTVTGNAKALSDGHKDTLITHPLAGVDTHDLSDLLCVFVGFLRILPHGHREQVHVLDILVRSCNPTCNNANDSFQPHVCQTDFCGKVHIGFSERIIAGGKARVSFE